MRDDDYVTGLAVLWVVCDGLTNPAIVAVKPTMAEAVATRTAYRQQGTSQAFVAAVVQVDAARSGPDAL